MPRLARRARCQVLLDFADVYGDTGAVEALSHDAYGPRLSIGCYPKPAHLTRRAVSQIWPLLKAFAESK